MKRLLPICLAISIVVGIVVLQAPSFSFADELDETSQKLAQKQTDLQKAQNALGTAKLQATQLSSSLTPLQQSLNIALAEVGVKQAQLDTTIADLDRRSALLTKQQQDRNQRIRSLYKQYKKDQVSPMLTIFSTNDMQSWSKMVGYHSSALNNDVSRIASLDQEVSQLNADRTKLQAEADKLKTQKDEIQGRVNSLKSQLANANVKQYAANTQIANLNKDIKGLSAKQQQILAQKAAANAQSTTVGGSEIVSTALPTPGFSGSAFAFASYGYPHRVGMSQYGAKGRAEAGQSYQQILTTYYAGTAVGSYSVPGTITVNGTNEYGQNFSNTTYGFDEYLKHLYEMPTHWHMEALKAQAIAARTYAVKWLRDRPGQAICPTQSCQVVKHEINSTRWQEAVDATSGIVVTHGGQPISTWYSSTVGGFTQSSAQVWGGSTPYTHVVKDYAGSWPDGGYDKQSPWYHKAWGSRDGGAYNPWLTKQETLNLLNAAIKYQQTSDAGSISADLNTFTEPLNTFTNFSFSQNQGTGQTDVVIVLGTNQGTVNISAKAVKAAVNLKAPGTIWLTSSLFDIISR